MLTNQLTHHYSCTYCFNLPLTWTCARHRQRPLSCRRPEDNARRQGQDLINSGVSLNRWFVIRIIINCCPSPYSWRYIRLPYWLTAFATTAVFGFGCRSIVAWTRPSSRPALPKITQIFNQYTLYHHDFHSVYFAVRHPHTINPLTIQTSPCGSSIHATTQR